MRRRDRTRPTGPGRWLAVLAVAIGVGLGAGCDRLHMREQAAIEPYEPDQQFDDRQSALPIPEGTVARGHGVDPLQSPDPADYASGRAVTRPPPERAGGPGPYPIPVTDDLMQRGQDQYNVYCSPCHGLDGDGNGVVVQRGMVAPPSYHTPRLRQRGPRYVVDVIANGFGRMFSYGARVDRRDRWAIALYVEALQFSQHGPIEQLSAEDRRKLGGSR